MALTATFSPNAKLLALFGDSLGNSITFSRGAAGKILVNGGVVPILGGTPTATNTEHLQALGQVGDDVITLDEASGALPSGNLVGGPGNDVLTGGSAGDILSGQSGNDRLLGKAGADTLSGGSGNDVLTGGPGNDEMFGQSGDDRMIWNPGDGNDVLEGGAGSDVSEVNGGNASEVFTLTANGSRVRFDGISPSPFFLDIGSTESLQLNMNGGDDRFSTSGNLADLIGITVDGGAGNDTILGGNMNDSLLGGDGNDFIDGNQGDDLALLGAGNDTFHWDPGDGSDAVAGDSGVDTLQFTGSNGNETITISARGARAEVARDVGNVVVGLEGVEHVNLSALGGADTIVVNDVRGTAVNEVNIDLSGTGGGGDGAPDTIVINPTTAADVITVTGNDGRVSIVGLAETVNITGFDQGDRIVINTLGGDDFVDASQLNSVMAFTADGGEGDDVLIGSVRADVLLGGTGDNVVIGGGGADTLGGSGDTVIIGGLIIALKDMLL